MSEALWLSLKLSFLTTLLLLLFSLPVGYLLAFRPFPGKGVIESLLLLPLVLPPTVLGFYLIVILEPSSPLGELVESVFGRTLLFSFEAILIGSLIYSLPFAVFPIRDALQGVSRRYLEIAYVYGYSKFETFRKVVLPNSWGGIFTACALVFAHTMGEFGVVLMIGGNIPGETRTLSIYIYDEVQSLNYTEAHRASMTLLLVSLLSLTIIFLMRGKWIRR